MSEIGIHRAALVDHLGAFAESQRDTIAEKWGADDSAVPTLMRWVYDHFEDLRERVAAAFESDDDAMDVMQTLALEHDLVVDVGWAGRKARKRLVEYGLMSVGRGASGTSAEGLMPAALAAVVAPLLVEVPSSMPLLLARSEVDHVERVAATHEVVGTTLLEKILTLSEWFAAPERAEDLPALLPTPEYVGPLLSALELGGMCFWQEVFGHDLHENPDYGSNVVAFMRSDDRDYERQVADYLVEAGLIFRVDEDPHPPLAIVPEELWNALWTIGRIWLMDWAGVGVEDALEQAVRRPHASAPEDLQATLKWFAVEADRGAIRAPAGIATDETMEHLVEVGGHDVSFWAHRLEIALELSALRLQRSGHAAENPTFRRVLELPRSAFARQVLFDWCTGYLGSTADARLGVALGLDDTWRREVVRYLKKYSEFTPLWLRHEGVELETTGSGYLRNAERSDEERLRMEIALTNGIVWSTKLTWLDLLSLLDDGLWYSRSALVEVLQTAAGLSTFAQLIHVLENPYLGYYLPVQRASVMSDSLQTPHFEAWFDELVDNLLEPLGVARFSDDGESVWLQASSLRVESPPGVNDEQREAIIREILQDPELEFRPPNSLPPERLHRVETAPEDGTIELDVPLDMIRQRLKGRVIVEFDGRRIQTLPEN